MTLLQPIALNNATSTERPTAVVFRRMLSGLMGTDVDADAAGVIGTSALAVTEHAGTPNNTVDIAAGGGFAEATEGASAGVYYLYNDATVSVTVTTGNATNPRHDLVIVEVEDSAEAGTPDDAHFVVVAGTAAASPVDPDLQALGYDNYITLARITVPALDTVITNSQITDLRTQAKAAQVNAGVADWATYTPGWFLGANAVTVGNGTIFGRYQRSGDTVRFSIAATVGSSTGFPANNTMTFALPIAARSGAVTGFPIGTVGGVDASPAQTSHGYAHIRITQDRIAVAWQDDTLWSGTAPWTWATGDTVYIEGAYEAA